MAFPLNLNFEGIPEKDIAAFSTAVTDTLDQLGFEYDADETSPPNEKGEVAYRVLTLVPPGEKRPFAEETK